MIVYIKILIWYFLANNADYIKIFGNNFQTRSITNLKKRSHYLAAWPTCRGEQNCVVSGKCGPGNSVGIATDYGLDGPGSNPGGDEIFRPSRTALESTQPQSATSCATSQSL